MLKKTQRLTTKEFDRCFSLGRRHHGEFATVITCEADVFQGAVVVGRKLSNKAVTRNRMRRQAYALLEHLQAESPVEGVYIVILKKTAMAVSQKEWLVGVEQQLRKLWS